MWHIIIYNKLLIEIFKLHLYYKRKLKLYIIRMGILSIKCIVLRYL